MKDPELLTQYVKHGSEQAFSELVARYTDIVYSACLRQLRDPGLAEDATQAVFVALAKKAPHLTGRDVLSGWLLRAAKFAALNSVKMEERRKAHEKEAGKMNKEKSELDAQWAGMASVLDDAVLSLSGRSRDAIVLKYYQGKSYAEIGDIFGISEAAAGMRVNYALKKLKKKFSKKSMGVSAAVLGRALTENAVEAAPAGLSASCHAAAMACVSGNIAGFAQVSIISKGILGMMLWGKIKLISAAVVLIACAVLSPAYIISKSSNDADPHGAGNGFRKQDFRIPLAVREPAGISRESAPVSGGIPLPRGKFFRQQPFALLREDGTEIPCQTSPLVEEEDGSLRWILLDFQDDIAASATMKYVLKPLPPSAYPEERVDISRDTDSIAVNTGRINFTVSKTEPFSLFESVEAGGRQIINGGEVSYIQMQGRAKYDDNNEWKPRTMTAGPPDSVKLVYAGPLRATVEVRGGFKDDPLKMQYKAWITAWAGKSHVYVKYTLCNSHPEQFCVVLVNRASVELELADVPAKILLGADKPIEVDPGSGEIWLHQGLLPGTEGGARAGQGEKIIWSGGGEKKPAAGWIAAGGIFVCDTLFTADPAKRVSVDGNKLRLDSIAPVFEGKNSPRTSRHGRWLIDCSHHSSEYLFDFYAAHNHEMLERIVSTARSRLHATPSARYMNESGALSIGNFGTLEEEKHWYEQHGLDYTSVSKKYRPEPHCGESRRAGDAVFVRRVNSHWDSEGDSTEGTLLMYMRTGDPGWWKYARAWARYHADLHALRTDGWTWKDGICHFRTGMRGCSPVRRNFNYIFGKPGRVHYRIDPPGEKDLFADAGAQMCQCHAYGTGLADYYCLTGERDALDALLDIVEVHRDVWFEKLRPGKSPVGGDYAFTRGFMVTARAAAAVPENYDIRRLCTLMAGSLWQSPVLDERGAHIAPLEKLPQGDSIEKAVVALGLETGTEGRKVFIRDPGTGKEWRPKGSVTWQNVYGQTAADICARNFENEDMQDYTIGFAKFCAKYLLRTKSGQVLAKTLLDVLRPDDVFDPTTKPVKGGYNKGYYTLFFADAAARGYSWTGEKHLLEKAGMFWKKGACADGTVKVFATHIKSNHDYVLHGSRLFYEWSHPREDSRPPEPVTDLKVTVNGGKATIIFTAPADKGGGRIMRYQVKCSELPILPYEQWDYVRDSGTKRNWWKAVNLKSEPTPGKPGTQESFIVTGVPGNAKYFAVRSFDDSSNRSGMSNVAETSR